MVRGRILVILGLAMVVAGSSLTLAAVRGSLRLVPVAVAVNDIPSFSPVSDEHVAMERRPAKGLPPGALQSAREVIGRYTTDLILAGEPFNEGRLAETGRDGRLAFRLAGNQRGFLLPLARQAEWGGALKPGDTIDVIWSRPPDREVEAFAVPILRGAKIVDLVGGARHGDERPTALVLSLTEREASKLALAMEAGQLYPALRGLEVWDDIGPGPVTARDLILPKPAPSREGGGPE